MTKTRVILLFAAVCLAMAASGALARSWFDTQPKSDHADRVQQYQFQNVNAVKDDDEELSQSSSDRPNMTRRSLGVVSPTAGSPGTEIDYTYDDWQWTYSGHHVEWRGKPYVQFSYVKQALGAGGTGKQGFNVYDPIVGDWPQSQGIGCQMQLDENIGLYPNLDVRSNGRVVMGGHQTKWTIGPPLDNVIWYQRTTPFTCVFDASVIDSSKYKTGMMNYKKDSARLYQILIELQEWGNDTITHLVGQMGPQGNSLPGKSALTVTTMQYFRKMSFSSAASWVGPVSLDTAQRMAALCASRVSPKVALVYLLYTPEASTNTQFPTGNFNDQAVYYRESDSAGVVWKSKVNITPYNRVTGPSYSPWVEAKGLYDSNDKLHIIFNAMPIPTDPYGHLWADWNLMRTGSSLLHWSNSTNAITRIYNAEWDTSVINDSAFCGWIGTNMLSLGAFGISECNGHVYVVWTMSTDIDGVPPVIGDCASGGVSSAVEIANGELFLSVSSDLSGLLWDNHRNLTNTRTPNCDSAGFGGVCMSDVKPTMSRYGMDITSFSEGTLTWPDTGVNPGPGPYTGNYYIHLQYLEDHYAGQKSLQGSSTTARGEWKLNPLKWMRLACVAPVSVALISYGPKAFGYPLWTHHNKPDTTTITVTNDGNIALNVATIGIKKTTMTGVDWLGTTASSLIVNAGTGNTSTFGVIVNKGGIVNSPGTVQVLTGEVYLKSNAAAPRDSVSIKISNFLVVDTLVGLKWDTVSTGCTRLIVSNNGDMGRRGVGTVNMDYVALGGECVTGTDTYLYDGGPIVIRKSGSDYIYSNALHQADFTTEQAFKPFSLGAPDSSIVGTGYDGYFTGTFVNRDTTIGVQRTYYAPTVGSDNCNFVIQKSVFFGLGGPQTNVTLGEVIDWDIPNYFTTPTDSTSNNDGRVLTSRNIVYQQGLDTSTTRCQKHYNRFGSIAMLGMYTAAEKAANTCANDVNMYGAYTMLNDTLFEYDTLSNTLEGAYFWNQMGVLSGLTAPPFQRRDLHMVMTYKHDVPSLDTLTVYSAVISVKDGDTSVLKTSVDKAMQWYSVNLRPQCYLGPCCALGSTNAPLPYMRGRAGNFDCDAGGNVDISDLGAIVEYAFIHPGHFPPGCECPQAGDLDGNGVGPDITDLGFLVDFAYIHPGNVASIALCH